jgi:hypothetical protein
LFLWFHFSVLRLRFRLYFFTAFLIGIFVFICIFYFVSKLFLF